MNNKTFETIEKTIVRLEACLETDDKLTGNARDDVIEAVSLLVKVYENSKPSNPS